LAQAIRYALNRIPKALSYLDNGVLKFDNDTAERAVKLVILGRKTCVFAGSLRSVNAMAIAFSLIETAKQNGVDP
jgi:transposase